MGSWWELMFHGLGLPVFSVWCLLDPWWQGELGASLFLMAGSSVAMMPYDRCETEFRDLFPAVKPSVIFKTVLASVILYAEWRWNTCWSSSFMCYQCFLSIAWTPNLLGLPNWSLSYCPVPVKHQGRLIWDLPLRLTLSIT